MMLQLEEACRPKQTDLYGVHACWVEVCCDKLKTRSGCILIPAVTLNLAILQTNPIPQPQVPPVEHT